MLMFLAYFFMYLTNVSAYSRPILGSTIERCPLEGFPAIRAKQKNKR